MCMPSPLNKAPPTVQIQYKEVLYCQSKARFGFPMVDLGGDKGPTYTNHPHGTWARQQVHCMQLHRAAGKHNWWVLTQYSTKFTWV